MNLNNLQFIKSAADSKNFIMDSRKKVVFAGKSNVGKSSVINRLLNRKNFARVGSAPGKTIHVNYFLIDNKLYFVDLPGYGYAKVSEAEKKRWASLMESYFQSDSIDFGVMIVDSRHAPTKDDITMAEWFKSSGCSFIIVANKVDKVKKSELEGNLNTIRESLKLEPNTKVIPFSAETGLGREILLSEIEKIL